MTLTGAGGVGKSRLALRVARIVQRAFPDGVTLVELDKIQDPGLIVHSITAALDLHDQSARTAESALIDYLSGKKLLIVVDNCEHLREACALIVSHLLASAPDLRVLATSREPLKAPGEHVWPVPPLSVPEDDGRLPQQPASQYEALALFQERASAVAPDFTLTPENQQAVVRLCARLDGLPLAIELAAVHVRVLSPVQILARLEDRFWLLTGESSRVLQRHQTLQAAITWSFDLCSELERIVWARCSVFPGEFDLAAAEFVCAGDAVASGDVLDGIAGLLDKSVLTKTETGQTARYRMLETIRHFGLERLAECGAETRLRRRHRDYYLALANRCDRESWSPHQLQWVKRLAAERANLFAALEFCLSWPSETRTGLRMGAALWFYWLACGFIRDGRHWLDRLLAADTEPSHERARALMVGGWATILQGDNTAGVELLNESAAVAKTVGDPQSAAYAEQILGLAKIFDQDPAGAVPLLDSAWESHRRLHEETAISLIGCAMRGLAAVMMQDLDRAAALVEECRQLCAPHGELWALSWSGYHQALTHWMAGHLEETLDTARETLRQKIELNDQLGMPYCIELLAWVAVEQNAPQHAAILFGAADALWKRLGARLSGYKTWLRWSDERRDRARAALGANAYDEQIAEGARRLQRETPRFLIEDSTRTGRSAPEVSAESKLTRREREVAELVAVGVTNREIAARLVISRRTAEAHVENILTKLGFTSRTQIAAWMAEHGDLRAGPRGHSGASAGPLPVTRGRLES
ncbi:ATP-binding protein [Saccharopolyspora mangrovi]|uniref:LuxR C-terminal-related transcriptional regulator n=1 Tax=Saccharopolyspora mangrovi TaxID=3082379 RepID=A0ABU6AJP0_9PSEU|nr:LuxR C-terminal-related transcriptional regulator [Saccharopolyspora sp. S2-29]MEB3371771.1 LuxR C-terminal-related transcriptional regulator [Saccharopolyspora sp. S2-29]